MKDIKTKNDTELSDLLTATREEVRVFKFGTSGSQTRDVKAERKARRNVARILTETTARAMKA